MNDKHEEVKKAAMSLDSHLNGYGLGNADSLLACIMYLCAKSVNDGLYKQVLLEALESCFDEMTSDLKLRSTIH